MVVSIEIFKYGNETLLNEVTCLDILYYVGSRHN